MGIDRRRRIASRLLTAGGSLLGAAAVFHVFAAPHLSQMLGRILEPKAYAFLEPVVSFTFLLNAVLLLPLSFSTVFSATGIRRGEPWAWWIGLVNALTVLALPCLLVWSMGLEYLRGTPLFVAGVASIAVAGLLMILSLLWAAPPRSRS